MIKLIERKNPPKWFKHGLPITCSIRNIGNLFNIVDAVLYYHNISWFICQNEIGVINHDFETSYKYVYYIRDGSEEILLLKKVYDLKPKITKEMLLQVKEKILK